MKQKVLDLLKRNHLKKNMVLSTVSGILTTEPGMIEHFVKNVPYCDIITTKSYQLKSTSGHREPIIFSPSKGTYGNFVGLRNPGLDNVLPELKRIKAENPNFVLNISLAGNTPESFVSAISKVSDFADIVELNFSCPHASAGFGASIGSDANVAAKYIKEINDNFKFRDFLLIVKLTPNADDIAEVAKAVVREGADGVALINTVGPYEYREKTSGESFFNKNEGGKGGMSGAQIKELALSCIKKVRFALGDEPIILGMGGVSTALDATEMLDAGADSVGLGSILSSVDFYSYNKFFNAIKSYRDVTSLIKTPYSKMQYKEHKILEKVDIGNDCIRLTLSGEVKCQAGEFVFLWIPQVGEKPFSVSTTTPLSFVIKRRGSFTNAICDAKVSSKIYSRGPYGKPMEVLESQKALLIAGGSGMAVLPLIAQRIYGKCHNIDIKIALTGDALNSTSSPSSFDFLKKYGKVEYVYDAGVQGRLINELDKKDVQGDIAFYVVGPTIMMDKVCKKLCELGANSAKIYLSVESLTLCGIGMCGECYCAGKLPCKEGTFYRYSDYININK